MPASRASKTRAAPKKRAATAAARKPAPKKKTGATPNAKPATRKAVATKSKTPAPRKRSPAATASPAPGAGGAPEWVIGEYGMLMSKDEYERMKDGYQRILAKKTSR